MHLNHTDSLQKIGPMQKYKMTVKSHNRERIIKTLTVYLVS